MATRNGNIPAKVLKKSFYLNKIALIINGCIETIIFYDDLKLAIVSPIVKNKLVLTKKIIDQPT